jgi:thiol-disulfide isomerase/thioredoxin
MEQLLGWAVVQPADKIQSGRQVAALYINYMKFKKIILILACIGYAKFAFTQSMSVPLALGAPYRENLATKPVKDTSICKNFPYASYPFHSLRRTTYNVVQGLFEHTLEGITNYREYINFVNRYRLDTLYIIKQKLPGNVIYIATGIDTKGIKHVRIDANGNHDFADEVEYTYDLSTKQNKSEPLKVKISYFDGQKISDKWVNMELDALKAFFTDASYESTNDKNLDVILAKSYPLLEGSLMLQDQAYTIQILDYDSLFKKSSFSIMIKRNPGIPNEKNNFRFSSKDTINIGYNKYLAAIDDRSLILTPSGRSQFAGGDFDTQAPEIAGLDYINKKSYSLKKELGNYVLIDFWGSWCVPCIELIPELKRVNSEYKHKIKFLSIAYDKKANIVQLEKLIRENELNWNHLLDDRENPINQIAKNYKVQQYPTTILIDPNGKVVFRSIASTGLKDLEKFLNSIGINPTNKDK